MFLVENHSLNQGDLVNLNLVDASKIAELTQTTQNTYYFKVQTITVSIIECPFPRLDHRRT